MKTRVLFFAILTALFLVPSEAFAQKTGVPDTGGMSAGELSAKGITLRMTYDDYKDLYDSRTYVREQFDPYSPVGTGIASFFIPGLGQMINGEAGRGLGMLFGNIGCLLGGVLVAALTSEPVTEGDTSKNRISAGGTAGAICCFAGALAIDVWSVCDAVKMSKIKNMYYRDCKKLMSGATDLRLMPSIACVPTGSSNTPAAGLTLALKF